MLNANESFQMGSQMKAIAREVVVTGIGAVTPYGVGASALWAGVSQGRSGVSWIESLGELDAAIYPVRYGAEVKGFDIDAQLKRHCEVRDEKSVQMGLVAAQEAFRQAQLIDGEDCIEESARSAPVIVGSGHGPCNEVAICYGAFFERGPRAVRPTSVPKGMYNSLASNLSIYFGLTGTNEVIASACASGTSAIGHGLILIRHGYADIVLCGAADAPITRPTLTGWTNMRVLAKHAEPQKASRPFDAQRNGLVIGEGAAMVILEAKQSAQERGVQPLARVVGYGAASDACHITAPSVNGQTKAMRRCLADAELEPEQIDYLNLHGTATKANDATEAQAVLEVFGPRRQQMPASSTKSMLGHSLGASGAIEFLICIMGLQNQFVPPTLNCDDPDPNIGLDYVSNTGRRHLMRLAMSNSFAFGGNNACVLIGDCR
jgi:3-oxoacyl-[acyl-carrier-protein] synthase II